MAISSEELHQIGQYVKENLHQWLPAAESKNPVIQGFDPDLRERIVRVEEALKQQGIRFEKMSEQVDKRSDQIDKRIDQIDKRIDQIDKRIDQIDKRIDQIDKRIDQLQEDMNRRFDQVDKRFEQVDKRFEQLTRRIDRFMIWSFGLYVTMAGIIIGIIKFT